MNRSAAPRRVRRSLEIAWADTDRYPALAYLAATGLLAVLVMARVGLPPIGLHGPLHYVGVMDPGCGLTRGMVALLRGRLGAAWTYNPASPVVLAGAVGVLVRAAVGRHSGRWLEVRIARRRRTVLLVGLVLLGLLWANQQRHADLLQAQARQEQAVTVAVAVAVRVSVAVSGAR